jgi:vacuolar iron transporter family protein
LTAQNTLERWRSEKTAAFLSSAVAAAEPDPAKAALFKGMTAAAEEQAGILAKDLGRAPDFTPSLRARLIATCIATFGPRAMRPILSATKVRGVSVYSGTTTAPAGHPWPKTVEDMGRQHRNFGGGTLRAGVFGVNDGLVSNTCLVHGRSWSRGRARRHRADWSRRAACRSILHGGRRATLSQGGGRGACPDLCSPRHSDHGSPQCRCPSHRQPGKGARYACPREELGLNPDDLRSPVGAALSSFVAFAIGASLPLIPFLLGAGNKAVIIAAAISGTALFVVGALLSLFSGKSAWLSGLRMLAIGAVAAAAATYGIGSLFNVSTS